MKNKTFFILVASLLVAFVIMVLADSYLRSKTEGREEPLLGQLLKDEQKAWLRGSEILANARDAQSEDDKAFRYLQAARFMQIAKKPAPQMDILIECTRECPNSQETIKAWVGIIGLKLSAKPPEKPIDEVNSLAEAIKKFSPITHKTILKEIKDTIAVLKKNKNEDLAEILTNAITPPKPSGEPEK